MKATLKTLSVLGLALFMAAAVSLISAKAEAQGQPGRIGDTMVIQYSYADIDAFVLNNAEVRGEIQTSIVNEIHRRNAIQADIVEKWQSLERAASRADSRNPLLRSRGNKAAMNQALLTAASRDNEKALKTLSEIADFTRGKARLTSVQKAKLSGFVFVDEIKLAKRADLVRVTTRLATLDEVKAVVLGADPVKPTGKFAKGMQILRTKKGGVMALGAIALIALQGYSMYESYQSEKVEAEYYLVYDDRVVAQ